MLSNKVGQHTLTHRLADRLAAMAACAYRCADDCRLPGRGDLAVAGQGGQQAFVTQILRPGLKPMRSFDMNLGQWALQAESLFFYFLANAPDD